jgi:hypothetical protein
MSSDLRLAETIGVLSLACDLADGFPPEKAPRTCLLAVHLASAHGLEPARVSEVYYAGLLRYIGCTAFAHEEAWYGAGDDIALRTTMAAVDPDDLRDSGMAVSGTRTFRPNLRPYAWWRPSSWSAWRSRSPASST